MTPETTTPDWAPPGAGIEFATRVVPGGRPRAPRPTLRRRPGARGAVVPDLEVLAASIRAGDRVALARGITLVESVSPAHRRAGEELLDALIPHAGGAWRVGITGVPGAGKSTFIDALGTRLCASGRRVAVLSVDPSSPVSHGSILGDKTRMERLSRNPLAFIRPTPSGGEGGGVARRTREAMILCEAAGYGTVLVETVGVGQGEIVVRGMVDCFLLLLIAGAGDELQGIKKGIVEMADILAVNKADGDNRPRAEAVRLEFERALHYLCAPEGAWHPPVLTCSSLRGDGVEEVWAAVGRFMAHAERTGEHAGRRRAQTLDWLHALVEQGIREAVLSRPEIAGLSGALEADVAAGRSAAPQAAARLLRAAGFAPAAPNPSLP